MAANVTYIPPKAAKPEALRVAAYCLSLIHIYPLLLCDKTHRRRTMMSGDDRQNSPSILRQNRPSATRARDRVKKIIMKE